MGEERIMQCLFTFTTYVMSKEFIASVILVRNICYENNFITYDVNKHFLTYVMKMYVIVRREKKKSERGP